MSCCEDEDTGLTTTKPCPLLDVAQHALWQLCLVLNGIQYKVKNWLKKEEGNYHPETVYVCIRNGEKITNSKQRIFISIFNVLLGPGPSITKVGPHGSNLTLLSCNMVLLLLLLRKSLFMLSMSMCHTNKLCLLRHIDVTETETNTDLTVTLCRHPTGRKMKLHLFKFHRGET